MTATLDVPEQNPPDLVLEQSADDYWNRYQLTFALYSVSDRAIPSAFDGSSQVSAGCCTRCTILGCCPATSRRSRRRCARR